VDRLLPRVSLLRARGLDLSAPRLLVSSFALLIAVGTAGFLWLPGLWVGPSVGFVDALFMATSAVCVTGLAVVDVSSRLTGWGQAWLLLLVQLGGLGIVTLAVLAFSALGRHASLEAEEAVGNPASILPSTSARALVRAVVRTTLAVEAIGAAALWLAWAGPLGPRAALWPALFHAVSAFCNAGFSTFATGLAAFAEAPATLAIVMALIVAGGIGFLVFEDVRLRLTGARRRLTNHSRLVLATSVLLLAVSTLLYAVFEARETLAPFGPLDRLVNAAFLAVTPRTAGFNTVDYDELANPSLLLTIALMWIGGSPGSTAGGVKTTTVALIALLLVARLRGREVTVANRSVPEATLQRAVGLAAGGLLLLVAAAFVLSWTELPAASDEQDRAHFVRLVFEAQSALGTVGLSMGVTGQLTPGGRLVIVALMFLGRVGPLAVLEAMARRSAGRARWRLAREDVLVG
jgi:trk system potassium uptake protein TrkH